MNISEIDIEIRRLKKLKRDIIEENKMNKLDKQVERLIWQEKIKPARQMMRLTMHDLGEKMNITKQTIFCYESRRTLVTDTRKKELEYFLGI